MGAYQYKTENEMFCEKKSSDNNSKPTWLHYKCVKDLPLHAVLCPHHVAVLEGSDHLPRVGAEQHLDTAQALSSRQHLQANTYLHTEKQNMLYNVYRVNIAAV